MEWNLFIYRGFIGGSDSKETAYNVGDLGLLPGMGKSPGEGNVNSLQYSGLENPMDREARKATVHGAAKSWTRLRDLVLYCVKCVFQGGCSRNGSGCFHHCDVRSQK